MKYEYNDVKNLSQCCGRRPWAQIFNIFVLVAQPSISWEWVREQVRDSVQIHTKIFQFQRCGNVVLCSEIFWIRLALRTFYICAINFRLQHKWTDHYQYAAKWNERTTTYDNNLLLPFREWNQEYSSITTIKGSEDCEWVCEWVKLEEIPISKQKCSKQSNNDSKQQQQTILGH